MSKSAVEALLFVSKEPLTLDHISSILSEPTPVVLRWLIELTKEYENRGILVRQVSGGFEMISSPQFSSFANQVAAEKKEWLTQASLETLAVIAYQQPIDRQAVALQRGVQTADFSIQNLIDKGLVIENTEGLCTTDRFLHHFGLNDLRELPDQKKNA